MRIALLLCAICIGTSCQFERIKEKSSLLTGLRMSNDSTEILINNKWVLRDSTVELNYPCTIDSVSFVLFQVFDDSLSYNFGLIPDISLSQVNHGLGQWLRNNYGLWSRTCLVEKFWAKGIMHPDDMSAIILTNYHKILNGKPTEVDKQVKMYKEFWKNEFEMEYRLQDSFEWDFPPSMWDMNITTYEKSN